MSSLFCGFDSLDLTQGGIARVGRLFYRILSEPELELCSSVGAVVFRDTAPPTESRFPVSCAYKSKLRYSFAVNTAAMRYTHFFYDFLGMGRAHCKIPGFKRPYACFVHGIEAWPGPWARQNRIDVARRASVLIANSQHTITRACELDKTFERAKVTWLATEDDALPAAATSTSERPRVLIVGRIDEGLKGHQELIHAWPTVVAAVPDAVLTIAGRGPRLAEFQRLAAESKVASQIEFLGFVPESEMPALWHRSSVFAMPGRGEGFGLTYIEAMRYGVPIIASIHDAGSEINVDGTTGFNVDLKRTSDLADRIIDLLRNRDLAAKLGQQGQARWQQYFRYSAFRERIVPIMRQFLDGNAASASASRL